MKKTLLFIIIGSVLLAAAGLSYLGYTMLTQETQLEIEESASTVLTDYRNLPVQELETSTMVEGLDAPWAMAWLPSGDMLVTERFGTLRMIREGVLLPDPISGTPEVFASGQGGLLDVSVHPEFEENQWIYLSYAHGTEEGNRLRVARARLVEMELLDLEVIFEVAQTKAGSSHFGSRFQWLPDGTLTFSVGDGGNPPIQYNGRLIREQAQSLNAHLGKIIRIHDDGTIPEDNPFVGRPDARHEIFSYGHRNVQGLTYDSDRNRLVVSEHGSKGGDELNHVSAGNNYGWPLATYSTEYDASGTPISPNQELPDAISPLGAWTPSIAPSELVYYTGDRYGDWKGDLFLSAMLLREDNSILAYTSSPAGAVLRISTDEQGTIVDQERLLVGEVRVRSVAQGPDGYLYVLTDDTSPQGKPGKQAGRVLRIEE